MRPITDDNPNWDYIGLDGKTHQYDEEQYAEILDDGTIILLQDF